MKEDNRELFKVTQKAFNNVCKKHGLDPWDLAEKEAPWRDLCLKILASNKKGKVGRPSRSLKEIQEIGGLAFARTIFSKINPETGIPLPIPKLSVTDGDVAIEMGIVGKQYDSGRHQNPSEIVRGLRSRYIKHREKLINDHAKNYLPSEHEIENQEDSIFHNIDKNNNQK